MIIAELVIIIAMWYLLEYVISIQAEATRDSLRAGIVFMRTYQNSTRTLLSFMLVYYYQQIWGRARGIFFSIPWPDNPFFMAGSFVGDSNTPRGLLQRRTVFRYVLATNFLIFVGISEKFKKAYPDPFLSLVELGLLTDDECQSIQERFVAFPYLSELSFVPLVWAQETIRASFENASSSASEAAVAARVFESIRDFRGNCAAVLFEVYLPFPLLLSQLVTVLTYCQLAVTLVAQQNSYEEGESVFVFPVFTVLEAVVYIGALRVGQIYTNPLGADDDDYEIVSFFNRNLKLANLYGCYGAGDDGGGVSGGPDGFCGFDIRANMPPVVSLEGVQKRCLQKVPVEFYAHKFSKTAVVGASLEGEHGSGVGCGVGGGVRTPPASSISTPQLRRNVEQRLKVGNKNAGVSSIFGADNNRSAQQPLLNKV
jgi:hypothetical protein